MSEVPSTTVPLPELWNFADSAYSISAIPDKPTVDPGDRVRFECYIYGTGPVIDHKILVHVPAGLLDGQVVARSFKFTRYPESCVGSQVVCPPQTDEMFNRFLIKLNPCYFSPMMASGHLFSEHQMVCAGDTHPPLAIEFSINSEAPSGLHQLDIEMVYATAKGVAITEVHPLLRVTSFGERNAHLLSGALTLLVFLTPILYSRFDKQRPWVLGILSAAFVILLMLLWA